MVQILNYFPGQTATIFLQTLDGYGNRADPDQPPSILRVIFPGFTLASGYPKSMNRLDLGLYYAQFTIPTGGTSVGSYLIDVFYDNPSDGYGPGHELYQLIVQASFGNFSTTVVG